MWCLALPLLAGEDTRLKLDLGESQSLNHLSFRTTEDGEVDLAGVCVSFPESSPPGESLTTCWLIHAESRREIWRLSEMSPAPPRLQGATPFQDRIMLPAGSYELYLGRVRRHEDVPPPPIAPVPPGRRGVDPGRATYVTLTAPSTRLTTDGALDRIAAMTESAVVSINRVTDGSSEVGYFRIKEEARLRLYALGEGKRRAGSIFDYAWLEDLTRNRKVWSMNPRTCDYAGGARKNIMAREVITLAPGKYALHYESDGSHAFGDWQDLPPADPYFWGITLWPHTESDVGKVLVLKEQVRKKPILEMVGIGNDAHRVMGLDVKEQVGLRLQCLGEGTWRMGMVDFGWIENARTGETVWRMSIQASVHAGGADKNRMTYEIVSLPPGRYLVHYQTDDSHSFPHWNAPAPFKSNSWGLILYPLEQEDREKVSVFEAKPRAEKALAELVKPAGNAYLEAGFKLSQETRLRVEAIGEGKDERLFDHGWIENDDTGRIVWQMRFQDTQHAGGALKNRSEVDVIVLPAGTYKLLYETDADHHYGAWNDEPPRMPEKYGIAVYLVRP